MAEIKGRFIVGDLDNSKLLRGFDDIEDACKYADRHKWLTDHDVIVIDAFDLWRNS